MKASLFAKRKKVSLWHALIVKSVLSGAYLSYSPGVFLTSMTTDIITLLEKAIVLAAKAAMFVIIAFLVLF